jgi:hypothetical protein
MKIEVILTVDDSDDIDQTDESGLTNRAYERLFHAANEAGFSVDSIEAIEGGS